MKTIVDNLRKLAICFTAADVHYVIMTDTRKNASSQLKIHHPIRDIVYDITNRFQCDVKITCDPKLLKCGIKQNNVICRQENPYLKFNMLRKFDREFEGQ